jgi:hypothetical protein
MDTPIPATLNIATVPAIKLNFDVAVLVRDFLRHALQNESVKSTAPDARISMVLDGLTQYIKEALDGPQNPVDAAPPGPAPDAAPPAAAAVAPTPPVETKQDC